MTENAAASPGSLEELFAEERRAFGSPDENDLCGLAFSGGGIRSATFSLGLLQELARRGLLGGFHYLSTVSGGGYAGGFWSAWRSRPANDGQDFPLPAGGVEPREIHHLREFGNFLRPRLNLVSFETGRLVASVVAALAPSLLASVSVVVLVVLAWLGLTVALTHTGMYASLALLLGLLLGGHLVFEWIWRSMRHEARLPGESFRYAVWWLVAAVPTAGLWLLAWWLALPPELFVSPLALADLAPADWTAVLLPVGPLLAGVVVLVVLRTLVSSFAGELSKRRLLHGTLDAVLSRSLLFATAWTVLGVLWVSGQVLAAEGVAGIASALAAAGAGGGVFSWARRFIGLQPNKPSGGKLRLLAGPVLLRLLAYATVAITVVAVASLLAMLYEAFGDAGLWGALAAAAAVVLFTLAFFDPQEVGFHSFYRARLVRAYLGASNDAAPPESTGETEGDDVSLSDLPGRPFHLVCCAANDLAGDPLASLHRGADSAVLSRLGLQVGERWERWPEPDSAPSLGAAMTASGAAFNSHMGALSMRLGQAVTFLLAALNLRLGLWVRHPPLAARNGPRLWRGHLFFRELLSLSNVDSRHVFLSDGGHYENMGIYELVRRRCRFILAADCGADPDYAFDDLGNALRRIRTNLGVEIDVDVGALKPGDDGLARQAMVAGTIRYPEGAGVLVLVKPTLTGNEPVDVAQYDRRNDAFPQETTADQFFDEAQWEAYRKLGQHVAAAFSALGSGSGAADLRRAFSRARYELLPKRQEPSAQQARLEGRWAELEARLAADATCAALAAQVLAADSTAGRRVSKAGAGAALPMVRRALQLMEAVYRAYDLGRGLLTPEDFGWLNRFGRWLSAPLVRSWWPWIEPLHSQEFAEFLEKWFQVARTQDLAGTVRPLTQKDHGYTVVRWDAGNRALDPDAVLLGYFLPLAGLGFDLLAGVVPVTVPEASDKEPDVTATWQDKDFFVPPGLWGRGIGDAFLRTLVEYLSQRHGARRFVAELDKKPGSSVIALYNACGFRRSGDKRFERVT